MSVSTYWETTGLLTVTRTWGCNEDDGRAAWDVKVYRSNSTSDAKFRKEIKYRECMKYQYQWFEGTYSEDGFGTP